MDKRVAVCCGEEIIDVVVKPGMTTTDVLAAAGLPTTNWLSNANNLHYGRDEPLYGQIRDGEKVFASSEIDVGRFAWR